MGARCASGAREHRDARISGRAVLAGLVYVVECEQAFAWALDHVEWRWRTAALVWNSDVRGRRAVVHGGTRIAVGPTDISFPRIMVADTPK